MAYTIPQSIPSKATKGEKRLFGILKNGLPDDYIVWYEPHISHQHPDFIILGPDLGLLIIEVKGWSINQIDKADPNYFSIWRKKYDGTKRLSREESPLTQAHRYFSKVSDRLKAYSVLCQPKGRYQGKLIFPIGTGAVMSNITTAQARRVDLNKILAKPDVIYRDELLAWEKLKGRALVGRLQDMFPVKFKFRPLTAQQMSTVRGILHPEIQIRHEPATSRSLSPEVEVELPSESKVIVSLDPEQETAARRIGDGHRLLSGVAGAGKTQILLARAKYLANNFPDYKILILCYQKSLAAYLRSLIYSDDSPNYMQQIEIWHFNGWAKCVLGKLPLPKDYPDKQVERQVIGKQLTQAFEEKGPKWDAVLIDEAHTFAPDWFRGCVAALKGGADGSLLIASDGNQKIHNRKPFSWISVGIKAQGRRTQKLKVNYRNTREIIEAAWATINLSQVPMTQNRTDDEITFPLIAPESVKKNGPVPVLHLTPDQKRSVRIARQKIALLIQEGYLTQDIAVIFHSRTNDSSSWSTRLKKELKAADIGVYQMTNARARSHYSIQIPGVRIVSVESALGLEFKAVVIMEVERFVDNHEDEAVRYRKLYVAMTRARERLHVLGSSSHPFMNQLKATKKFLVG